MSRTLAIGDIHGCLKALLKLDEELVFGPGDLVITLGDYVDRGPDTKGVIEYLIQLRERTRLITLRGNHEVIMMTARTRGTDYLASWLGVGGQQTLESYGAKNWEGVPKAHWQFLMDTQAFFETDTDIFVHAGVNPALPLEQQTETELYWQRFNGSEKPHCSGKRMICGHTSQHNGLPHDLGHAVCIDTWAYGQGWLTCLDTGSNEYWQADRKGSLRKAALKKRPQP